LNPLSALLASAISISEDTDLVGSPTLSRSQPDLSGISTAYLVSAVENNLSQ